MTRAVTYLILASNDPRRPPTIVETEIGHALSDVLQEIWDDTYGPVESVMAWDIGAGRSEDVTAHVAHELAARTFREGNTPDAVWRFCEPREVECFDDDRHAHLLRDPNAEHRLSRRELVGGR